MTLELISDLVPTPQTKVILDSCLAHIPLGPCHTNQFDNREKNFSICYLSKK
jgi:hypothetical protein